MERMTDNEMLEKLSKLKIRELAAIIMSDGIGHSAKYEWHELYLSKQVAGRAETHGTNYVLRDDVANKQARIKYERYAGFMFISKLENMVGIVDYVDKVLDMCIKKGYLDVAEQLLENIARGRIGTYESKMTDEDRRNYILDKLKKIARGYAQTTRFSIRIPEELVKNGEWVGSSASDRSAEELDSLISAIIQRWEKRYPNIPFEFSAEDAQGIVDGNSDMVTYEKFELMQEISDLKDERTPYIEQFKRFLHLVYLGRFGKFENKRQIHSMLAGVYNHYMASSNAQKDVISDPKGNVARARKAIRDYADKQRVSESSDELCAERIARKY